jgi:hypothetical protein
MSQEPQPGYQAQNPGHSVTNVPGWLTEGNARLMYIAIVVAVFIALLLADREERSHANSSRSRRVPSEPSQSE